MCAGSQQTTKARRHANTRPMSTDDNQRVVHLVQRVHGGRQEHFVALADGLNEGRYEVMVVGALPRELRRRLSNLGIRWANLGFPRGFGLRENLRAIQGLARLLDSQQPVLVHAHGYHAGLLASYVVGRQRPPPRFVCTATDLPGASALRTPARLAERLACRRVLGRADRTIALSDAVRDELRRISPRAADRAVVIRGGVNAYKYDVVIDQGLKRRELGVSPEAIVIAFVGRLVPEKGPSVFLDAAARLSRAIANVEFLVVGEGRLRDSLQRAAHDLGIYGSVVFTGYREDVASVLPVVDVVAIPSLTAGFSFVAVEALAAGSMVVASDTGGLREILADAPNASLVPPGNSMALARAIVNMLSRVDEDDEPTTVSDIVEGIGGQKVPLLVSEASYGLTDEDDWRAGSYGRPRKDLPAGQRYVRDRFSLQRAVAETGRLYAELLGDGG